MNKQQRIAQKEKQATLRVGIVSMITLVIVLAAAWQLSMPSASVPVLVPRAPLDMEAYIKATVAKEDVCPGYIPLAVYAFNLTNQTEKFVCCGTGFYDTNNGPQIITAEHIFRVDNPGDRIYSVHALRGKLRPERCFMGEIVRSRAFLPKMSDDRDAVIAKLSTVITTFKPYSHFLHDEINQNFWGEVVIATAKIPRVRSVATGAYFGTVGYARGASTNSPLFVIIDKHSWTGESGSGFVDDLNGLWVLHAGPAEPDLENGIIAECKQLSGKTIHGATTLSGPFGGAYGK
jgi:hypothetical protein